MAELRAAETGVRADRVLVGLGHIGEDEYARLLSTWIGLPFIALGERPREDCALEDDRLIDAAAAGLIAMHHRGGIRVAAAPGIVDSRRLCEASASRTPDGAPLAIVSATELRRFVSRHTARALGTRAASALHRSRPDLSAGPVRGSAGGRLALAAAGVAAAVAAVMAPHAALLAAELALGVVFLAWTGLRIAGMLRAPAAGMARTSIGDDRLPVYTVIVALYREAAAAAQLVAALRALDYPAEKLDIKFVVEPADTETRAALDRLAPGPPFEIVVAPDAGPRTKPKALNAALPFARGPLVAVYDAEDRPEPNQLRLAIEAFSAGDSRLACVQARLTIDNTDDSWLARLFTAEYAALFDVFLPGLAAWKLPLPLGGSSNHFRTDVLRQVGAWDPYNVTEDADLGMRLARFGYRSAVIASTTYEEAPARFGPWMRQRTRWFKGWMQTWLVHSRTPRRLARELGWRGFVAFQLLVGGTALASLVHLVFAVMLAWEVLAPAGGSLFVGLHIATLVCGYGVSALLGIVGLARRGLLASAWVLLLIPVYWVLLSLAAWRALFQLVADPYRWEKTEHGLARTSRLAAQAQPVKDSASNPSPPLPAGA